MIRKRIRIVAQTVQFWFRKPGGCLIVYIRRIARVLTLNQQRLYYLMVEPKQSVGAKSEKKESKSDEVRHRLSQRLRNRFTQCFSSTSPSPSGILRTKSKCIRPKPVNKLIFASVFFERMELKDFLLVMG